MEYQWLENLKVVTEDELKATLTTQPRTLVFFGASWDGGSRRMHVQLLAIQKENNLVIVALDADYEPNFPLYHRLHFQTTPHLLAYENGQKVAQSVGYRPMNSLIEWIDQVFPGLSESK
jgi:thioredoxin-like negative regulator of GroEL